MDPDPTLEKQPGSRLQEKFVFRGILMPDPSLSQNTDPDPTLYEIRTQIRKPYDRDRYPDPQCWPH